jgi:hypothetical protein
MGNKCEWKDGKFEGCDAYNLSYAMFMNSKSEVNGWSKHKKIGYDTYSNFHFCPFCGADIRKPEPPEPLIIRSGNTWVAHFEGIDYLWTFRAKSTPPIFWDKGAHRIDRGWKSFTGENPDITELTDEIALLRPMVKDASEILMLIYSQGADLQITMNQKNGVDLFETAGCLLATYHDLKEQEPDKCHNVDCRFYFGFKKSGCTTYDDIKKCKVANELKGQEK